MGLSSLPGYTVGIPGDTLLAALLDERTDELLERSVERVETCMIDVYASLYAAAYAALACQIDVMFTRMHELGHATEFSQANRPQCFHELFRGPPFYVDR